MPINDDAVVDKIEKAMDNMEAIIRQLREDLATIRKENEVTDD
jgi:hypothetical protein